MPSFQVLRATNIPYYSTCSEGVDGRHLYLFLPLEGDQFLPDLSRMKLGAVLLACNENSHYLSYWPIVKDTWLKLVQVPVHLVFVGRQLPEQLKGDRYVSHFQWPLVPEGYQTISKTWPTATVAQTIRLLYPGLMEVDGAVLIGDIDCAPLNPEYFHTEVAKTKEDQFVSLRGLLEQHKEVAMMYVAAHPKTWGEMFGIKSMIDIIGKLNEWSRDFPADGKHGSLGWTTDQRELYKVVKQWQRDKPDRIRVVDWSWDIPRLCRSMPAEWINGLSEPLKSRLAYKHYIDFHMPSLNQYPKQILEILNFALQAHHQMKAQSTAQGSSL